MRSSDWSFSTPTEAQFINILSSSPRLRILHLGLDLDNRRSYNASIMPVRLDDLERLELISRDFDQFAAFLRVIAPGTKPLQMSLSLKRCFGEPTSIFLNEAQEFFGRSNVTIFTMGVPEDCRRADMVMDVLPPLEHLYLKSLARNTPFTLSPAPNNQGSLAQHSHFNNLHIHSGSIDMDGLRQMIQNHMVQTLKLRDCIVSLNGGNISRKEVRRQLSDIGLIVKLSRSRCNDGRIPKTS